MDAQSRFALIVDAFVSSGAPPKRAPAQPARDPSAEPGDWQAQRVARVRGRLVSFSDDADSADAADEDASN